MQFFQFTSPVKQFYTFVLKRLIGKFLSNELDVAQLDIQITQGIVELHDLTLDCHILNDLIQGLPFEIVAAELDRIRIVIPITDLWNGSCLLSIDGLLIKVSPLIDMHQDNISMHKSSWLAELATSLSKESNNGNNNSTENVELYRGLHNVLSNKPFYDECNEDEDNETNHEHDHNENQINSGMQLISDLVERILYNLKIEINNTNFIITHPSPLDKNCDSILKIQLRELRVTNIDIDYNESDDDDDDDDEDNKEEESLSKLTKRITFCGLIVQLFHTSLTESIVSLSSDLNNENNVIIHGEPEEIGQRSFIDIEAPLNNNNDDADDNENSKRTKIEISGFLRNIRAVLNPLQLALFLDIFKSISLSSELVAKTIENDSDCDNLQILDFELKIHEAVLILLENTDDIVPNDWYLTQSHNYDDDNNNDNNHNCKLTASYPWIPELLIPQIALKLSNICINFQQIPAQAVCVINISYLQIVEFLPINYYSNSLKIKVKPRQMIKRQIFSLNTMKTRTDDWKPQISVSIRNIYRKRNDINIEILPAKIELDFELFSRFNQISKAFAFIAKMDYLLPSSVNIINAQKQKDAIQLQTTTIKTSSIYIRFSVNNECNMPQKENIWFQFHELVAKNETNGAKNKQTSEIWNLECKKLNVLLEYNDMKHLILKSSDNNTVRIYINNNDDIYKHYDNDGDDDDEIQDPHFRCWESNTNDMKFPKGDKIASTHKFELKAKRLAPTHIDIILQNANVACSKSQYDLFIQLYMKAIDSLEKVEAQTYPPLYKTATHNFNINDDEIPSFAAQIIEETQPHKKRQTQAIRPHFISSVKIIIKRGCVDINEDVDKNVDKKGIISVIEPTASSIMAQTFRLEFKSLQITHIVKQQELEELQEPHHNSKVSYLTLRTNDICLLEFDEVLESFGDNVSQEYLMIHNNDNINKKIDSKAHPLLFKTLETQTFGFNQAEEDENEDTQQQNDVLHLFLSFRVKQTECDHTFLQIFTLVNLRALSHEFRLESEWSTKLAEFFSFSVDLKPNDKAHANENDSLLQNISNIYVHAYDCCISYNPIPTIQRLVITSEKIRISTNIIALSPMISLNIECFDGAVYLHPNALKSFSKSLSQLFVTKNQLNKPFLHRLPGNLLADHLDSIGFVGILDFDWFEAVISQNKKITKNEIAIKGGCIKVKTCEDSTKSLLSICKYFINQIIKQPNIEEVELLIPSNVAYNNNDDDEHMINNDNDEHMINFNILGNIDEHMFATNINNIGIDSSDTSSIASDDDDNIRFITDYARAQSNPDSLNKEYVDLEKERQLTTPFKKHSLKLKSTKKNVEAEAEAAAAQSQHDAFGGWYNKNAAHHSQGLDLNYLDKKLQEKFHVLTDPNLPKKYPQPITQIKIKEISLHWKIFGGSDFNSNDHNHINNDNNNNNKHQFFKHEYAPAEKQNIDNCNYHHNYRSNRKIDQVMQVCLNNIQLSYYQFHPNETIANRLVLSIHNVEVLDLIQKSNFHKFLCFYRKQNNVIKSMKPMVKLEMNSMRAEPDKDPDRLETDILICLLPLRLNIDQLAIDFLITFFSSFVDEATDNNNNDDEDDDDDDDDEEKKEEDNDNDNDVVAAAAAGAGDDIIYFESFVFCDLILCIDYNPRRVDFDRLRNGDYSQFVHLFPLSLVEIKLQKFEISGCNGWDSCFVELAKFWAVDFAKHQTHKYVAGIQPVRSLVNMGSGIADLVIIPLEQYHRDGRITKGIQQGAKSAVQKITLETLDLSDGLFTSVHSFLTTLESLFHSKSTRKKIKDKRKKHMFRKRRSNYLGRSTHHEPHNTTEGLRQATESFTKGIIEAAHCIGFVPMEKYKSSGLPAGFKSVLKGVPSAILHPLIGTTQAVSNAIVGVRNSIDSPLNDHGHNENHD